MKTKTLRIPLRSTLARALPRLFVLGWAATLSVGTSKRLYGKKLKSPRDPLSRRLRILAADKEQKKGEPKRPEGSVWLKENVNNQGCFADQVLDFDLRLPVRNASAETLVCTEENVTLRVDGEAKKVDNVSFRLAGEKRAGPRYDSKLSAGERGVLVVTAQSILPKKRLKKVDEIVLTFGEECGGAELTFEDIKGIPVRPAH